MRTMRYNPVSIVLHWLMAAIIILTWSIAITISDMPLSPMRIAGYSWHKWLGLTVLALVVIRLIWRGLHPAPKLTIPMPLWQERAMQATHIALYLLMFSIPLVGWLMSSAKGYTVNYFGLFELPDLLPKDKVLGHQLKEVHEYLADLLVALFSLHVLAALKHQFIDKDGLLSRMSLCSCWKKRG